MTTSTTLPKCVIWDLDNTLWRGVAVEGDDVVFHDGRLGLIAELDRRGVLNSVASRSDSDVAMATLRRSRIAELLVAPQVSWQSKSVSVGALIDSFGFRQQDFLFVDDDPFERAEVSSAYPELVCLSPEEAEDFLHTTAGSAPISAEAASRREFYAAEFERQAAERDAPRREDFLGSLDLRMNIDSATEDDIVRCEELTRRTTQLNTTGQVLTAEELLGLLSDPGHAVLVIRLSDRFGDYGLVGLAVVELGSQHWTLRLLATSCRVLSRGVGGVVLNVLSQEARQRGSRLLVEYRQTKRNRPMLMALRFSGFAPLPGQDDTAGDVLRMVASDMSPLAVPPYFRIERSLAGLPAAATQ